MDFKFSDLLDFSKVPIKVFILFIIVSVILLFGPKEFLAQLKLSEFEKDYGKYFGIIFLVSSSFVTLSIIYFFVNRITAKFRGDEFDKVVKEEIQCLDTFEQSVLREFVVCGKKVLAMPMDNPVLAGMLQKGILKRVSNMGDGMYFPMTISKIADKYLTEKHLGFSKNSSQEELQDFFLSNRPSWSSDYFYRDLNK